VNSIERRSSSAHDQCESHALAARLVGAALLVYAIAWASIGVAAQADATSDKPLSVLDVRPSIHMVAGACGNVGVHGGGNGVILIDTGRAEASEAFFRRLES
jgi:hypothetical protein